MGWRGCAVAAALMLLVLPVLPVLLVFDILYEPRLGADYDIYRYWQS